MNLRDSLMSDVDAEWILERTDLPCYGDIKNEKVKHLANDLIIRDPDQARVVPMSWCVGPVFQMRLLLVVMSLLMPCMVIVLGVAASECHGEVVVLPKWLWLVCLPFLIYHFYVEFKTLSYILIPFFQGVCRFKILGVTVGFQTWYLYCLGKGAMFVVSAATNSTFAATWLVASRSCPQPVLDEMWRRSWSQTTT